MNAARLAFTLIRVPRLFSFLIFWPLLLGLVLVFIQLGFSAAFTRVTTENSESLRKELTAEPRRSPTRFFLFGQYTPLEPPQLCLPEDTCPISPTDVTLRANKVNDADIAGVRQFFMGNVERIHLCEACTSELTIDMTTNPTKLTIGGLYGFLVFVISDRSFTNQLRKYRLESLEERERIFSAHGVPHLQSPGLRKAIALAGNEGIAAVVLNVASLVVITLWLMLRAHRRVLDYFTRSGALLPMVAACGKESFYRSLWLITTVRTICFLLAALPASYFFFVQVLKPEERAYFTNNGTYIALWALTTLLSAAALTIVGSIADLKHRHSWVSFLYKYVPLTLCVLGTSLWCLVIFLDAPAARVVQQFLTIMPLLGLTPVIIAPLVHISWWSLITHASLATLSIALLLRYNARWFAAHLEEL